ncbi:hypothetical protein ES705_50908 [subsurface metagenome]
MKCAVEHGDRNRFLNGRLEPEVVKVQCTTGAIAGNPNGQCRDSLQVRAKRCKVCKVDLPLHPFYVGHIAGIVQPGAVDLHVQLPGVPWHLGRLTSTIPLELVYPASIFAATCTRILHISPFQRM